MPRRIRMQQKMRRKRNWKKKKEFRNKATLNRTVAAFGKGAWSPFSRQYATKLKYSTIVNISGTVLRSRDHVFRANQLYDPDFTGTGHQPRFFDQLAAIYRVYRVMGSKIRVQYVPTTPATTSQNVSLFVIPSSTVTSLSDSEYRDLSELPLSKTRFANFYNTQLTINHYMSTALAQGVQSNVVKTADDYIGTVDGVVTPTKENFWHVGLSLVNESNSVIDGYLTVDIEYYVNFERLQTPNRS